MSAVVGLVCKGCNRPGRKPATPVAQAPGTVPIASKGLCTRCINAGKRKSSSNSMTSASLEMAVTLPAEDIAAVVRMVKSRFPDEPELLEMLGIAS